VVPRTSNRVADHDALNERAVIVRAVRSDREKFIANPRQHYVLITDMAKQLGAFLEFILRNAKGEIRTTGFGAI
jgi:hypothetical protein